MDEHLRYIEVNRTTDQSHPMIQQEEFDVSILIFFLFIVLHNSLGRDIHPTDV